MQVNINGIETRYVLSNEGGGPWLTFIHQLGGDLSVWDQLAGYFRDDYTVLRYDLRGHGKTAVSGEPFGIADLSHDLAALLDALGAPSTHLVGMSMGGMIAQQFALDHPVARRHPDDCRHHRRHAARRPRDMGSTCRGGAQGRHGVARARDIEPLADARFSGRTSRSGRADSRRVDPYVARRLRHGVRSPARFRSTR